MPQRVQLVRMTTEEIQAYIERDIAVFARENVAAGYWGEEEALRRSVQAHQRILPEGPGTKGHHFFRTVDGPKGEQVGLAWLRQDSETDPPTGFIYDLAIDALFQGRGYGEATMRALETIAVEMGLASLGLHVFAHNIAARRLHEKLGYTTRSLNMVKPLT
jgi:ribosomal protein S18 acetylase RimI-like enzyme